MARSSPYSQLHGVRVALSNCPPRFGHSSCTCRATPGSGTRGILETLYSTGMRPLELFGLKLFDRTFERGTVMIWHGKGKKDRIMPIKDRTLA
ncbi:tyrosine-type recombinase/integrase [Caballeronia fortuita]|uniref:tyrosine-type recombinase/integrase n=1 Tax=Caballeronia fortuita TaxID=1777138 RepID=UPI0009419BF0|nr:tyrosine-type recombinase/integrase [Caballeronia fortuita]